MATKNTTPATDPKAVANIVVAERGVGRVYQETSGRYVVHARRTVGGFRTRRRFEKVSEARAEFKTFVAEYRLSEKVAAEAAAKAEAKAEKKAAPKSA